MTPNAAEAMALQALGWIAQQDDLMGVFLGTTGSSLDEVRAQATEPAFLGSVMDFLLMDDAWVTGFCDANQLDYRQPMMARQQLPGGDLPNWT
ncbi:uncharacterized protein DUF3572 [Litoreibacter ponti]|uniref:Uncharacterized protein DUF3572 n=1 Tax=Litoreibacter ponti TaxID=1510457 RepID=A0A2T6BLL5_9RHOB|nr:DUF3572 domain-containing protein [Litoreibacter ponti]PTX56877.1 uncharacterized protein DUF3572 [Litoreibacter ponti]